MSHGRIRNNFIIHVICILGAFALCMMSMMITKKDLREPVPSDCFDDLSMPYNTLEILETSNLVANNCKVKDAHVFEPGDDPQLYVWFREGRQQKVRSVHIELEDIFPYDLLCTLYYPDRQGNYVEDCSELATLRKGNRDLFYTIPDTIDYPIPGIRIDIDDEYTIKALEISEDRLSGEYVLGDSFPKKTLVICFIGWLMILELIAFFRSSVKDVFTRLWKERKKVVWSIFFFVGCCFAGFLLGLIVFHFTDKYYSGFWILVFEACAALLGIEAVLLKRKNPAPVPVNTSPERKWTLVLFWAGMIIFAGLILFQWGEGMQADGEWVSNVRFQFPYIFAIVQIFILSFIFEKYVLNTYEDNISFFNIYLVCILGMGMAYIFVFLPYISPDETAHYTSAYRFSDFLLGKIGLLGDKRLLMRMEDYDFYQGYSKVMNPYYYMQITENMTLFQTQAGQIITSESMVTNALFSYFPSGVGIAVARILHLSGSMTFYAGRIANLLFYTGVMYYLMKKISFGRSALFAISMMPMTMHTIGSYSYDVATFCFVALFVTHVMSLICSEEKVSQRNFALCIVFGMLMAPSKLVFLPLLFLVFLIPAEKIGRSKADGRKKQILIIAGGVLAAVLVMGLIAVLGENSAIAEMVKEDGSVNMLVASHEEGYTISWIIHHLGTYFLMIIRTFIKMMDHYFFTMVGNSLGWLDIGLPITYAVISFIIFLLALNIRDEASEHIQISLGKKTWIILLCLGTVVLTMLAMTLDFTPMKFNYVHGVQGRYFTPLLVLAIWIFRNPAVEVNKSIRKKVVLFSMMLNFWILVYVFTHCIVGSPA